MPSIAQMKKLTAGLPTKSEKMRVLARAGYSRGEISRFLGTSYQFVRNVLVREEARSGGAEFRDVGDAPAIEPSTPETNRVQLGPNGEVAIPQSLVRALGLSPGTTLIAVADDDEIRLMTIPTAVRKAQAIVRQYVPAGVSLVDELLEDRRREVERESNE